MKVKIGCIAKFLSEFASRPENKDLLIIGNDRGYGKADFFFEDGTGKMNIHIDVCMDNPGGEFWLKTAAQKLATLPDAQTSIIVVEQIVPPLELVA